MNHEPGMAAPAPGSWTMSAPRMQPVDHQDGMIAAPTAEGVPKNGGEFFYSNLGIKPYTSLHYSLTVSKPFKPICMYNMAYVGTNIQDDDDDDGDDFSYCTVSNIGRIYRQAWLECNLQPKGL